MEKYFVLFVFTVLTLSAIPEVTLSLQNTFEESKLVPDVVPIAPKDILKIKYPSGVEVSEGNELTPTNVKDIPTLEWSGTDADSFYTLCMTDPDAPSRANPIHREFLHWLVGNIPGSDISKGVTIAEYIGSGPPKGTDLHRYIFLLYKQSGKITFTEEKSSNKSMQGRPQFSVAKFADKYSLGNPIAGNFFLAQYDDYVPTLHKQLEN